jgi:hypothetical protein
LLKAYPDSTYKIYENAQGWCYHTDGRTAWVKTGVTVEGKEYIEMLPVMDFKNRSIPLEQITSFDVNKAIQRSLTKAVARHGLGLYIYAGEDLPEGEEVPEPPKPQKSNAQIVRDWCKAHNMTTEGFGNWRNVALAQGIIPDKRANELTPEELKNLIAFVEANDVRDA